MSKKILIIDDSDDILELMQFVLEGAGFEVIASKDSAPLKKLSALMPALILMDNSLGGVFCPMPKDDPAARHFPSANTELDKMTAESGADGYLAKPFNIDELITVATKYIR